MDDTLHNLTNQLLDCQEERGRLNDEGVSLRDQIKRLRGQIIELERRHKTALDNAYAAGFDAGKRDARQGGQQ